MQVSTGWVEIMGWIYSDMEERDEKCLLAKTGDLIAIWGQDIINSTVLL